MKTPTNNPMDDDYGRDVSGCIIVLGVCLAVIILAAIIIIFT